MLACSPRRIAVVVCCTWAVAVYTEWIWRVRGECERADGVHRTRIDRELRNSVSGFSRCPPDFPSCVTATDSGALLREFGMDAHSTGTQLDAPRSAWCSFVRVLPNPLVGAFAAAELLGDGHTRGDHGSSYAENTEPTGESRHSGDCGDTGALTDSGVCDRAEPRERADFQLTHLSSSPLRLRDPNAYIAVEDRYRATVNAFDSQCGCRSWLFWAQQPVHTERRAPELVVTGLDAPAVLAEIKKREELEATFGASVREWMTSSERGDIASGTRFMVKSWFYSCADESAAAVFRYVEIAYLAPVGWTGRASYSMAVYAVIFSTIAPLGCTCRCDPSVRHAMPSAVSMYLFSLLASNVDAKKIANGV